MDMTDTSESFSAFCLVVLSSLLRHVVLAALSSRMATTVQRKGEYVGRLSMITVYPVKSMKGIDVEMADCDYNGLRVGDLIKDRAWMVTIGNFNYYTARQKPKMVTIEPSFHGNWLHLDAPGMVTMKIPAIMNLQDGPTAKAKVWGESVEGIDCGDAVAEWVSSYVDTPNLRVLYHAQENASRSVQHGETRWHKTAKSVDQVGFQDGFPFMLMSQASVDELSQRLENKISVRAFRPNFVVSTDNPPFSEDDWLEISIGEAVFTNIKACQRCNMITVDPDTGVADYKKEPLATLRRYRLTEPEYGQSPCIGINLVLAKDGKVKVGDEIYVTKR